MEYTRVQAEVISRYRARIAALTTEVDALEKRTKDVLDELISLRESMRLMDHPPPGALSSCASSTTDPRPMVALNFPTTPPTPGTTVQSHLPPPSRNLRSNASTFNPRAGFRRKSSDGQPNYQPRLPGFLNRRNIASGTSGSIGVGVISPTPSTLDAPEIHQSPVPSQSSTLCASDRGAGLDDEELPHFVDPKPAPLKASTTKWTRKPLADKEKNVERKVGGLLNKLTVENFDSISDQIIAWANKSETEKDGQTLIHVIKLIFERATDQAAWSDIYARLCKKMVETISPNIRDENVQNAEGKPIAGGQLFRRYLLNRCQEDFERGWASDSPAVGKAAQKSREPVLYSDEYYAAQRAKRRGLGLIRFIGEMYKLQMLTENIVHGCIRRLLGGVDDPEPEEEEIESLCQLFTTVGKLLENPKARARMDVYFAKVKELSESDLVAVRIKWMLQDLIELRGREWTPRNQVAFPTAIPQASEEVAKQTVQAEKAAANRTVASAGPSSQGWGLDRGPMGEKHADAGPVAGRSPPRPLSNAGALSDSDGVNTSDPLVIGPSSTSDATEPSTPPEDSSPDIFVMLGRDVQAILETASRQTRPLGGTTGVGSTSEPQRRRLQLRPRSIPPERGSRGLIVGISTSLDRTR